MRHMTDLNPLGAADHDAYHRSSAADASLYPGAAPFHPHYTTSSASQSTIPFRIYHMPSNVAPSTFNPTAAAFHPFHVGAPRQAPSGHITPPVLLQAPLSATPAMLVCTWTTSSRNNYYSACSDDAQYDAQHQQTSSRNDDTLGIPSPTSSEIEYNTDRFSGPAQFGGTPLRNLAPEHLEHRPPAL